MPESIAKLQQQLKRLKQENLQLQQTCQQLQNNQENLEQIIGETNAKLLRSEMTSLELEQVFSACTDALWVVREDCTVVRANQAMLDMLGKPESEVLGHVCNKLLDYHHCIGGKCPLKATHKERLEFDIQLDGETAQGNYILSTAPLVTLDGAQGIIGQFKNITSRKKAEAALEKANVALQRMAMIDGLTQIANRRCFDETLQKEWLRLTREQKPLSLLLGDIDYFKKFNDHYGHHAGDDCLRLVSKALADSVLRPADLAARYGGEEFVMLLPGVDIQGALQVGQRILSAIRELAIKHQKSEISDTVTISLGAATLTPSVERAPETLILSADEALYQAKEQGRNRIVPAQPADLAIVSK